MNAGAQTFESFKQAAFHSNPSKINIIFHNLNRINQASHHHFQKRPFTHTKSIFPHLTSLTSLSMEKKDQNSGRRHRDEPTSYGRSLRRKLNEEHKDSDGAIDYQSPVDLHQQLVCQIRTQVEILDSDLSSTVEGRESAKNAVTILSELAKNGKRNSNNEHKWKTCAV